MNENAKTVIERRIAAKDDEGNAIETAEQVFRRVADNIASADANYGADEDAVKSVSDRFFSLMDRLDFIPNSPTLVNAGRDLQQLSACFVIPVGDSMEEIFDAVKTAALIHKTGGGTGFSFSRLRPSNSRVDKTSGIASGPVSFMQVFDKATEVIKQGGTRRGANMGILRVDHPDIMDFITLKNEGKVMQNFNISVGVTDAFMDAYQKGEEYDIIDPRSKEVVKKYNARTVFRAIVEGAHKTGDPGVVFLDRINAGKANPVPTLGPIEATNPCGEQPLYPYDSCNLGSINLGNFVKRDGIDYARLGEVVFDAVHFLDNVIDKTKAPVEMIGVMNRNIRRIGLGVMGWADMLIQLQIPYFSEEAVSLAEEVMAFIQTRADEASRMLALKRGPFPFIGDSIYADTPIRNSTRTTIAPTGTISIIAGASSGIEPLFGLAFVRSHYLDKDDPSKRHEMVEVNPYFYDWVNQNYETESAEQIFYAASKGWGRKRFKEEMQIDIPEYFITAHEVPPHVHVMMQAAFQHFTDNAVSKTINLPNSASVEDVAASYLIAYKLGCLGVTVYRDGSHNDQVLKSVKEEDGKEVVAGVEWQQRRVPPVTRQAIHHKFRVGEFEGYLGVGTYEDGAPCEVFIIGNKAGSTTRGYLDTIGILLSNELQRGVTVGELAHKLAGTRFEPAGSTGNPDIPISTSIIDYVVRFLRLSFGGANTGDIQEQKTLAGDLCPDCDSELYYGEGCLSCPNPTCGYSKCG